MGRATSKGNEEKSKMKQPSDMLRRDLNTRGIDLWSNVLPLDHGGTPPFCWKTTAELESLQQQLTSLYKQECIKGGWFDTLRVELAPENINVTVICPGPVMSDLTNNAFSDAKDRSLKFYDDEIPCKQANLLDTDLLVLDVIDDFELSVTVVNAENLVSAIRLLIWLLISLNTEKLRSASADVTGRVLANTSKFLMFVKKLELQILMIWSKYQGQRRQSVLQAKLASTDTDVPFSSHDLEAVESWIQGRLPVHWKTAVVIPIPKPAPVLLLAAPSAIKDLEQARTHQDGKNAWPVMFRKRTLTYKGRLPDNTPITLAELHAIQAALALKLSRHNSKDIIIHSNAMAALTILENRIYKTYPEIHQKFSNQPNSFIDKEPNRPSIGSQAMSTLTETNTLTDRPISPPV
ncbi:hypothetical protein LSH36_463g04007 [Paralvinella palmiformis]|uniref:Uncharacterized protein n=1 Tax=Paralvinella palmiformis TaxID=53620 RepID=A0AAD9JAJ9_9ANNE|nr:hypothetical protein LSH36_463g04007 [Paralvinella palmiformis]